MAAPKAKVSRAEQMYGPPPRHKRKVRMTAKMKKKNTALGLVLFLILSVSDRSWGHRRRYTRAQIRALAENAGMQCVTIIPFNRFCYVPWWVAGRLLRRCHFSLLQVKLVNWIAPVLRRLDRFVPLPPLSLIAVFEKPRRAGPSSPAASVEDWNSSSVLVP